MQGIVKIYNPVTRDGIILSEGDFKEIKLAEDALVDSVFRMLRPGQRVNFELNDAGEAQGLNLGSEQDMATPT